MDQLGRPVIVTLTRHGAALAREIAVKKGFEWHARKDSFDQGQAKSDQKPDAVFDQTMPYFQDLFSARRPIIGIVPQVSSCGHCLDF